MSLEAPEGQVVIPVSTLNKMGEQREELRDALETAAARASVLEGERDRLRAALAFYADEDNYEGYAPVECRVADDGEDGGCEFDRGAIARAALESLSGGDA